MIKDKMKLRVQSISLDKYVGVKWLFYLMIISFSLSNYLGFKSHQEKEKNKKEIQAKKNELIGRKDYVFEVLGKMDNNKLAVKTENKRTVYSLPVSTTDYWNTEIGDKIRRNLSNKELLKMTDGGSREIEKIDDEIAVLGGIIYAFIGGVVLTICSIIVYAKFMDFYSDSIFKSSKLRTVFILWYIASIVYLIYEALSI